MRCYKCLTGAIAPASKLRVNMIFEAFIDKILLKQKVGSPKTLAPAFPLPTQASTHTLSRTHTHTHTHTHAYTHTHFASLRKLFLDILREIK